MSWRVTYDISDGWTRTYKCRNRITGFLFMLWCRVWSYPAKLERWD